MHSGTDWLWYSDTGSTLKASIDGETGHFIGAPSMEGFHTNCGISNSGTTFTIAGYDGTALSATNPCVIGIRSNTAGRTALAFFTSNVSVTHGATSQSDGNVMGITSTVNWASTMPLFGGVIYNGTTPYFTISRLPYVVSGAADTALWQLGDTDGDAQLDVGILTTGLTLSAWVDLPITRVFWFDATYAATGEAWTFAVTGKNGFNNNYATIEYTLPAGQMGGESGKTFTVTDGGTALTFSAVSQATYYLHSDGMTTVTHAHSTQSANGADGTAVRWALPFTATANANERVFGVGHGQVATLNAVFAPYVTNGLSYAIAPYTNPSGSSTNALDNEYSDTNDFIYFKITYKAF